MALLDVTALIVVALTIFNLTQIVLLYPAPVGAEKPGGRRRGARAGTPQRTRRRHARRSTRSSSTQISSAAREANAIISQRLFSWTDLLNRSRDDAAR